METRTLGKNLKVSAIGLGCMGFSHAYGEPTEEADAIERLRDAVDIGYTFFDTAEIYGTFENPHGNEILVGNAFKDLGDEVVIATKFGIRFDTSSGKFPYPLIPDSKPERIRSSVDGSLKRLRRDHIDLYLQHRMDASIPPEEVAGAISDLIKEGKVIHWGVSEATEDYIRRANAVCPIAAIENRYSMMARWHENLFPILEELGIGFIAFSPIANGMLSGAYDKDYRFDPKSDYRSGMPQFSEGAFEKNRELQRLINDLARERDATPAQISMAWMLRKRPYIVPIPGSRKSVRIKENAGAADINLSGEDVLAIDIALSRMDMSAVFGGSEVLTTKPAGAK
ncbi:MAG: aldo/keto reductase [Spirochaetae bacterium HGW-Spirochaetae-3]|nr:MAG: aldo/keto reductase [Spirochaetae bacterium HGW-Spirochaetae-3]